MATIILGALGFISGNYLYQAFGPQNWMVAHERSFFQLAVLGWICLVMAVSPPAKH